jgi:cardiolipin synthase
MANELLLAKEPPGVSTAPAFQFFTKPEYYADLIGRLSRARPGERFITANMVTEPIDPDVAPIIAAMKQAARRGVRVSLITDAFNFLVSNPGAPAEALQRALDELTAAGAHCVVTNRPRIRLTNPYAGRSHIKFTIIGDRYYVGGCNLESYRNLDTMVAATDPKVADWLAQLGERLLDAGRSAGAIGSHDVTFQANPSTSFFVDNGTRGRSLILDEAFKFIDSARERVFISCQYFPNSVTARHLRAARKRGVAVTIVYNHPDNYYLQIDHLLRHGIMLAERLQNPPAFFQHAVRREDGYLHAKLIASESGAMVGSHNYLTAGVNLGTAELSMRVMDPQFSLEAVLTVLRQLPSSFKLEALKLDKNYHNK